MSQFKQEQAQRMLYLFTIARQRYLESGGDPKHSANEQWLTQAEKEELLSLGEQVFTEQYINEYKNQKQRQNQQVI
ncbi:hypothetical protein C7H19_06585 [Aphanothece hegewaldii CCALA 016]|uniref:Uncharacterized protein n=2 Tax=Aphanothece TaxID=1121 RepID=A0A2T1M0E0_9CHRO|nr:hypothetical protein C7H19_06585 [Aphanothece hegewaldii CCALA 016]